MKQARMALKAIWNYIELVKQGSDTYQREVLLDQMVQLWHTLAVINYKC